MLFCGTVLLTDNDTAEEIFGWRFQTGDRVLLCWFDGTDYRENYFKIAGCIDDILDLYNDRDDSGKRLGMGGGWFLIPQELIKNMISDSYSLYYKFIISVEDWENDTVVRKFLEHIVDKDSTLSFWTLSEEMEVDKGSYLSLKYMIYGISAFIIGFALINLINTLVSNVMSRKQEFAMLRSIGMKERQLSQMIISEGLILAVRNIIITSVFGTAAGYVLIYAAKNIGLNYLHWHFPTPYLLGYIMFVIAAPVIISEIIIKILDKKTLVERLREAE